MKPSGAVWAKLWGAELWGLGLSAMRLPRMPRREIESRNRASTPPRNRRKGVRRCKGKRRGEGAAKGAGKALLEARLERCLETRQGLRKSARRHFAGAVR